MMSFEFITATSLLSPGVVAERREKCNFIENTLGHHLANSNNISLNPMTVFTENQSLQMVEQIGGKVEHRTSRSEKSPGYMSNYMD